MDGFLGLSRATGLLLFAESYAPNHGLGPLFAPVDVLQLSSSLFALHHQLDHELNPDDSTDHLRWIAKENVWIFFFVTGGGAEEDSILLVLTISRGFDWEEAATWAQRLIAKVLLHGPEKKVLRDFHCIDWLLHDYLGAWINRDVLFVLLYTASPSEPPPPPAVPVIHSDPVYQTWLTAEMRLHTATPMHPGVTTTDLETVPLRGSLAGNAWNKALALGSTSFHAILRRGKSLERPNTKQTTTSPWCFFGFDDSFVLKISDCDELVDETNAVWSDRNKSARAEEETVIDDERGDAHRGSLRILRQQTFKHPASQGLCLDLIEYHTSGRARARESSFNQNSNDDNSGLVVRMIIGHTNNHQHEGKGQTQTPLLMPSRLRHMCLLGATCLQQHMLPQFVAANPESNPYPNPNTTPNGAAISTTNTNTKTNTIKTTTFVYQP